MKPLLSGDHDPHLIGKSFVGPVSHLPGSAAAWFSVPAAFLLYMRTPLFFIVRSDSRHADEPAAAPDESRAARR